MHIERDGGTATSSSERVLCTVYTYDSVKEFGMCTVLALLGPKRYGLHPRRALLLRTFALAQLVADRATLRRNIIVPRPSRWRPGLRGEEAGGRWLDEFVAFDIL